MATTPSLAATSRSNVAADYTPSLATATRNNVAADSGRPPKTFMKWFSLILLMVQSLLFGICFRYASIRSHGKFSNLTVVLVSEMLKMIISAVAIGLTQEEGLLASMNKMATQERRQTLLMGVPGIIYGVQNFLFFIGHANLSVALYQVSKQAAIPCTAIMAFILLRQKQSQDKIIALCFIIVGVCVSTVKGDVVSTGSTNYGILCVLVACACSGFASAFTEKLLKNCAFGIWERNVQLAAFGCFFAISGILFEDPEILLSKRFFDGYDWAVGVVIVVQVMGGLFTAAVLKYADSVSKCVVKSAVVVLGMVLSRVIFSEGPALTSISFVFGGAVVIYGSALYTLGSDLMVPNILLQKVRATSPVAGNKVAEVDDEDKSVFGTPTDIESASTNPVSPTVVGTGNTNPIDSDDESPVVSEDASLIKVSRKTS